MKKYFPLFLCLLILVLCQCTNNQTQAPVDADTTGQETDELGTIEIEVTGDATAKEHFMDGLLLLHSFEYADAAEQFQKAQAMDSTFVMAYWGEAMTKNHPLWRAQYTEEAQAILERLAPDREARLALARTELEKDLLTGAEILFGDGSNKEDRDILYRDHMASLQQKYPDNNEVSSLYALSLLGSSSDGRDYDLYEKAATIAQGIISENDKHPGALHYLIHAYDDPEHAAKALQAANNYSKVAPDAGHALHMPSHIYIALGMWDEVIRSNIASYDASVERMKRKELDNDARGYHAYKWLMYAKLQKGLFEEAREQVENVKKYVSENPSSRARSHLAQMQALYLNETDNWNAPLASDEVDVSDLNVSLKAVYAFTQGNRQHHQEDKKALSATINNLKQDIKNAESDVLVKGGKMCSGVSYYNQLPSQADIDRAKVILHQLNAMAALLANNEQTAEAEMQKAIRLEDEVSFMFGPPEVIRPSPEFYGTYLMEKGKHAEARAMFEKVLDRAPNRLIPTKVLKELTDI